MLPAPQARNGRAGWSTTAGRLGAGVCLLLIAACAGIERAGVAPEPAPPSVVPTVPAAKAQVSAKPAPSTPKATAKVLVPAPVAQVAKKEAPVATVPAHPAAPPIDLKALESRLRDTQAIGVFTKLTLKNQIDELLDRLRAFHQGKVKTSLSDLRRSYDMLVLKVLALLQDADPPLASAVAGSREAIWGILSNPAKFAAV
jgi:hypothetical protein